MKPDIEIEFSCRPGGYSGEELEALNPSFSTEYNTIIGFRWQSSAEGLESWSLIVKVLAAIGGVAGSVIIKELCQDLYAWSKEHLLKVLRRKRHNCGSFHLQFSDSEVEMITEYPNDEMLVILATLPSLLELIDPNISDIWDVYVEDETARIVPAYKGVEMKLFGEVETGRAEEVQAVIDRWSQRQ